MTNEYWNRPCAVAGLTSYRYHGTFGWIMIGARDTAGALRQAARSTSAPIRIDRLQVWDGAKYIALKTDQTKGESK